MIRKRLKKAMPTFLAWLPDPEDVPVAIESPELEEAFVEPEPVKAEVLPFVAAAAPVQAVEDVPATVAKQLEARPTTSICHMCSREVVAWRRYGDDTIVCFECVWGGPL